MTKAEQLYGDILRLSRPEPEEILREYPRMPLAARAKIFSPFSALRGHGDILAEEDERLLHTQRIALSEDAAEALSHRLSRLKKGTRITAICFMPDSPGSEMGLRRSFWGTVREIDFAAGVLRLMSPKDSAEPYRVQREIALPLVDLCEIFIEE